MVVLDLFADVAIVQLDRGLRINVVVLKYLGELGCRWCVVHIMLHFAVLSLSFFPLFTLLIVTVNDFLYLIYNADLSIPYRLPQ